MADVALVQNGEVISQLQSSNVRLSVCASCCFENLTIGNRINVDGMFGPNQAIEDFARNHGTTAQALKVLRCVCVRVDLRI
jgi:hypothetical protein